MEIDATAETVPPQRFEEFRQLLVARYPALSVQQQKIARFVLDHPNDAALDTVAVLARRVGVQPSALVRFAQSLGYDGFSELQLVFRGRLLISFDTYRERLETLGPVPAPEGSLLGGFVDEAVEALQLLRTGIPDARLDEAAAIVAGARHVFVLAQGRPFPVAFHLLFALTRLRKRCTLLDNAGGLARQQLDLATADDALVALSFRPYTQLTLDLAAEQSARGVPLVAITDAPFSPLARDAQVALEIRDPGKEVFQALTAALCLGQALAVAAGRRLSEEGTA